MTALGLIRPSVLAAGGLGENPDDPMLALLRARKCAMIQPRQTKSTSAVLAKGKPQSSEVRPVSTRAIVVSISRLEVV